MSSKLDIDILYRPHELNDIIRRRELHDKGILLVVSVNTGQMFQLAMKRDCKNMKEGVSESVALVYQESEIWALINVTNGEKLIFSVFIKRSNSNLAHNKQRDSAYRTARQVYGETKLSDNWELVDKTDTNRIKSILRAGIAQAQRCFAPLV